MDQVIIYVVDGQEATHIGTVKGLYDVEPRAKLVEIKAVDSSQDIHSQAKRVKKAA